MNLTTQSQLAHLIDEFKLLQTDADSHAFEPKWRSFYDNLNQEDAKIAAKAWFGAIKENLSEIRKIVDVMSNEDKAQFAGSFEPLKNHAFFQMPLTH